MISLESHLSLHGAGKEALKEKLLHPSSFNSPANIGQIKEKEHPPIELVELIFPPLKPLICQAVASPRC